MVRSIGSREHPDLRPPPSLKVAAAFVLLEAVLLIGYGLVLVGSVSSSRLTLGVTNTLFFLVYGGGLGYCGTQLHRVRSWSRAPIVLAQLIQLLVAYSFTGGDTTLAAVAMAALAVVTLAAVFHPASTRALGVDADHLR